MANITKLTPNYFITWRLQIRSLLEVHDLHVFIADEDNTPAETVTTATAANQPNPNFAAWKRQDKLLFSAVLGSLSLSVQPIVARTTTTRDLWQTLSSTYGKKSRGHIHQIRDQLKDIFTGNKSIHNYMCDIIDKSDKLAFLDAPLPHEDLLDYITSGLGEDYRAIIEMASGKTDFSVLVTANATQFPSRPPHPSSHGDYNPSCGGYRPSRPYLGKCQICGVQGHGARRCPQYRSPSPNPSYSPHYSGPYRAHAPWSVPHLPLPTPQWQQQPQAHHTTSSPHPDLSPWLLDSAGSHHIASDLSNLSLHAPYTGGENVMVGNGSNLPINHSDFIYLPSQSRNLRLTDVLCVPAMKKILISTNKLCQTNNVMTQLCPFTIWVKDLRTGKILLSRKANEGVYEWPITVPNTVPTSVYTFSCSKKASPSS
ncbi:PREDICTED: uncharacterized protein LOC104709430 [Camelina sativa]|uniref:Uncharacterized protein LOC104709430 n=1 Tax=Camelina sativa TaxID=90675 RepID=A0ABM0TCT1_CAMSA|nr:PREDICTED: uncharacterized protein LOC104709430 [Camelina sativa]